MVNNRSLLFRTFRRTGSITDFLSYQNACAHTTRTLKNAKRNNWKHFCSNLVPSNSIQHLWSVARRFKNCITPLTRPDNEDWFEVFCSKIAPCYVPTKSESLPRYDHDVSPTHILTNNFSMSELNYAISSRKSTASGLDNISPVMLKHLPTIALESLLALMNKILSTQQIPPSWCSYKVIPIAKQNSNTSFRPIALFCIMQDI